MSSALPVDSLLSEPSGKAGAIPIETIEKRSIAQELCLVAQLLCFFAVITIILKLAVSVVLAT